MKFYLSSYKFGNEIDKAFLKEWIKEHGNSLAFFEASRDCYEESDLKREKINSNINYNKKLLQQVYADLNLNQIDPRTSTNLVQFNNNYRKTRKSLND